MARLQRCAHQLVWLNPLKAHPGLRAAHPRHAGRSAARGPFPGRKLACIAGRVGGPDGRWIRMKDVLEDVQAWIDRGDRVAIATVVGVKRSAPRAPGAKMAVNDSGDVSGAVSGGCVEGAVVEAASEVLRGDGPQASALRDRRQRGLGCWTSVRRGDRCLCGGIPEVSLQSEFAGIAARDGRAALVTVIAGDRAGREAAGARRRQHRGQPRQRRARPRGRRRGRGAALGRALRDARGRRRPRCSSTWSHRHRGS